MASHADGVSRWSRVPGVEFREDASCVPPRYVWRPLREKCLSAASSQSQDVQRLASALSALASLTAALSDAPPSVASSTESGVQVVSVMSPPPTLLPSLETLKEWWLARSRSTTSSSLLPEPRLSCRWPSDSDRRTRTDFLEAPHTTEDPFPPPLQPPYTELRQADSRARRRAAAALRLESVLEILFLPAAVPVPDRTR